jgi:D-sedoheptulose 7-phosphate isomerase
MSTDVSLFARSRYITGYLADLNRILAEMEDQFATALPAMADVLQEARRAGRNIYVMGNGGSGSAASHFATDLNKYTVTPGERRFKCIALTDNVPLILALGNDIGYEDIFAEQLRNFAEPGDVLIGISGSGNSPNCLNAIEYARERGIRVITWTGYGGGEMARHADLKLVIPSDSMVRCEDAHVIIHHCLVSMLKAELDAAHGIGAPVPA